MTWTKVFKTDIKITNSTTIPTKNRTLSGEYAFIKVKSYTNINFQMASKKNIDKI